MTTSSCWHPIGQGEPHPWTPAELPLCDPDGVVRRGAMHHGDDYECTGHAHWSGLHIRCTSPAHDPGGRLPGVAVIGVLRVEPVAAGSGLAANGRRLAWFTDDELRAELGRRAAPAGS